MISYSYRRHGCPDRAEVLERFVKILDDKNDDVAKAEKLILKWLRDAVALKAEYAEEQEARQVELEEMCKRVEEQMAEERAQTTVTRVTDILGLRKIMQQQHPDKGGDVEAFLSAKKNLEELRNTR